MISALGRERLKQALMEKLSGLGQMEWRRGQVKGSEKKKRKKRNT